MSHNPLHGDSRKLQSYAHCMMVEEDIEDRV